jgi:hypothetical protein
MEMVWKILMNPALYAGVASAAASKASNVETGVAVFFGLFAIIVAIQQKKS